jgi:hypothetical protein
MSSNPKVSKKLPLGLSKKQWIDFENLEGKETTNQKKKASSETLKENTKSHFDIF